MQLVPPIKKHPVSVVLLFSFSLLCGLCSQIVETFVWEKTAMQNGGRTRLFSFSLFFFLSYFQHRMISSSHSSVRGIQYSSSPQGPQCQKSDLTNFLAISDHLFSSIIFGIQFRSLPCLVSQHITKSLLWLNLFKFNVKVGMWVSICHNLYVDFSEFHGFIKIDTWMWYFYFSPGLSKSTKRGHLDSCLKLFYFLFEVFFPFCICILPHV